VFILFKNDYLVILFSFSSNLPMVKTHLVY